MTADVPEDILREVLRNDPLGRADKELKTRRGAERFSIYLPVGVHDVWSRVLSRFAETAPWCYWDQTTLAAALKLLERTPAETLTQISRYANKIDLGLDNLFRKAPIIAYEKRFDETSARGLLRLATEFHPEYLRYSQQIYGNLLVLYWILLHPKNKSFSMNGATAAIKSHRYEVLLAGYDDAVRNSIAHGGVVFGGLGIEYFTDGILKSEMSAYEFLDKFDALVCTSNALAIALILFLARHLDMSALQSDAVPLSIISLLVAADTERNGLEWLGMVESNLSATGSQLHVAVRTSIRSRPAILLEVARIATRLLEYGASKYSRFLFEIDYGLTISSLAVMPVQDLKRLLQEDAPFVRLGEVFRETQLLWYDESATRLKMRILWLSFASGMRLMRENFQRDLQRAGKRLGAGRYRIRSVHEINNKSSRRLPRVQVEAVLNDPASADNREDIREIVAAVIQEANQEWLRTRFGRLAWLLKWVLHPKYIWVSLYRVDGTLRWLGSQSWLTGNLVAQAEKIFDVGKPPVSVPNAQEIWRGIRFRYEMEKRYTGG